MKRLLAIFVTLLATSAFATQTPIVRNVRFGSHPTFDRMVIDIDGYAPQVRVTKPYSLRTDGEGAPVNLQGRANVRIALSPAVGHDEDGRNLYRGPNRIRDVRMRYIHGFQKLGDFEAVVSFGITTDISNPRVRVTRLYNPTRIVIDISRSR